MREYTKTYCSPLGEITLAAFEEGLSGLWFNGQKYYAATLSDGAQQGELPVFAEAVRWLDIYFSGSKPDFCPPLAPRGSEFRQRVWKLLCDIPYGQTITYGELARKLETEYGKRASAQAVGGAVGHNPISIIIPCHRVVGADGSLTGYAGGISRKQQLLRLEGAFSEDFYLPTKGTAL